MYSFIRQCLFAMDAERAHKIALNGLAIAAKLGLTNLLPKAKATGVQVMGLSFPNRIGLAAGLDKNAEYIDALASLGFGFIEVGTITPKPQPGNPKPRLFRLIKQESLINRMGFNNKGMEYAAQQLEKMKYRGILGINIGKNKDTAPADTINDYILCFRALAKFASFVTINISSPNTQGLRDLQQADQLQDLLVAMKHEQELFKQQTQKYVPLVVKIAPDLDEQSVIELAQVLLQQKIDGVIATNTTSSRTHLENSPYANEAGGASGRCLQARSTLVIKQLATALKGEIPIIAAGGVMDEQSAQEKLAAGASLLQVYTGFIYSGPGLIRRLIAK